MPPYDRRLRRCRQRLLAVGADALELFPGANLRYLTGFAADPGERHLLLFVPRRGDPAMLVPELYEEQVRATAAPEVADLRVWADGEDPRAALAALLEGLALPEAPRLLVDDTMWARFTQDLRATLPGASWGLAGEVLAPLRARKDGAELDALTRAGEIADAVVGDLRERGPDVVGDSEADLAAYVEDRLRGRGGEGVAFETVVAAGPNGARPHHGHGDRTVRAGEPVVLDFGTRVDGYRSDQTRTLVFDGDPPEEVRAVHRAVREAQAAGVDAVAPGVRAGAVDAAARDVLEAAGYGNRFLHRTGHGVGLEIHEEPFVVAGGERELEPGMVFSVEPGVYVPGEFGVRIEDLVVVTEGGCRRLNHTDRGWRC